MANFPQNPTSGQIFVTSNVNYTWTGVAWEALSAPGNSLDDLDDVSSSSATTNQGLKWSGSAWIPEDYAVDTHNHTLNSLTVPSGDVSLNSKKITNLAAPTADADASTKLYVDTEISDLVDSAPGALNTLNELAAALGDDASYASTITTALAGKSASGHDHDGAYAAKASGNTAANQINCTDNESTDLDCSIVFVDGATGAQGAETDGDLTYNPSTGKVTATKFVGDGSELTNVSGSSEWTESGGIISPANSSDTAVVVGGTTESNAAITLKTSGIGIFSSNLLTGGTGGSWDHALYSSGGASFNRNKDGQSYFRVSGDNDTELIHAKYSTDKVSIGAGSDPSEKLDVGGTVKATEFSGSGASLTGIPTTALTGTITDAQLTDDYAADDHNHDSSYAAKASGNTAANEINCTDNESTNEDCSIVFVDGATGAQGAETDGDLTYNPSTGKVTATKFAGDGSLLTGVGASLTVKESDGSPSISNISTIEFDSGTGLNVTDEGSGVAKISVGSHWKTIKVLGEDDLVPDGEEDLEIIAGTGITITTDNSATPEQELEIKVTPGTYAANVHNHTLNSLTAPTGDVSLNSKKITSLATPTADADASTKGYVDTEISGLVDSAPGALNTLNELAAALGDDASYASTITTALAGKSATGHNHTLNGLTAPTGDVSLNSKKITSLATPTTGTDAATKAYVDSNSGGSSTLAGLTDTGISTPLDGHIPVYDDSTDKWENKALSGDVTITKEGVATVANDSHTHSAYAASSHNHSAANITSGTLALARGGTGATTQQAALDAITGTGTNTQVLTLAGGNAGWADAAEGGGGSTLTCQAGPPNSPSLGDMWYETDINVFYTRIEDSAGTEVWLDLSTAGGGGGGGGGNWTDSPEDASLDGVVALKKQSSSPSATADFGKVYVKDFTTTPTAAEVLFHLNDNVTDSSSNSNTGAPTSITYAASEAGASETGFGKSAVFDGTSNTTGGDSYITFDDIDIGDSDFTCEFWIKHGSSGTSRAMISIITGDSMGTGYFAITKGSNNTITVFYWTGSTYNNLNYNPGSTVGTWYHYAVVRKGTTHSFYAGVAGDATGTRIGSSTETVYDVGGEGDDWVIGRLRTGAIGAYNFTGEIDEVLISKEARYDGTEYNLPVAPYSMATVTTSELYFKNSAGTETKLT